MHCSKCGKKRRLGEKYCTSCGNEYAAKRMNVEVIEENFKALIVKIKNLINGLKTENNVMKKSVAWGQIKDKLVPVIKYGLSLIILVVLLEGVFLAVQKHVNDLVEKQEQQKIELIARQQELEKNISSLDKSIQTINTQMATAEQNISNVEQKLGELESNTFTMTEADVEVLKQSKEQALAELQDWIVFIFDEYGKMSVNNHIYEENTFEEMFTSEVIGELSGGNTVVEGTITTFVEGVSEGQSISEIKNNILANGGEWITQDVTAYIGEKLVGGSVLSVLDTANSILTNKPQLSYLIEQLEMSIQEDYFLCFYEVLALEEWDDELYFECNRKANQLQYLLGEIEAYTGDEMGADIWRAFYYGVGVYGIDYYGNDKLVEVYGEE